MNYSKNLETAIQEYENHKPYPQHSIDWICNRIDWCWKWRKINRTEMEQFSDRIIKVMEDN